MGARPSFPVVELPRDRVVVVTGGNTGLGYEIAKWLAVMGATVIIACRSEQRATQAIQRMQDEYGKLKVDITATHQIRVYDHLALEYMDLDLGSMKSTLKFVEDFKKSGRKLHVLICNAGIGLAPYERTEDGFEKMLQVNYLSHFLIVAKLLPVMLTSGEDCRILLMSSEGHKTCGFDINSINYEGPANKFGRLDYYGRSKLYQIMQMFAMARRLEHSNVTINCSDPGIVATEIDRSFQDSFFWSKFFPGVTKICGVTRTPLQGATAMINAAVNPELAAISGRYYRDCKDSSKSATATNVENQELLWKKTLQFLERYLTAQDLEVLAGTNTGIE